jgi:hypothetical protein
MRVFDPDPEQGNQYLKEFKVKYPGTLFHDGACVYQAEKNVNGKCGCSDN